MLQDARQAVDVEHMRNIALSGVVLIFELLLVVGYVAWSVAARTALAIAPNQ